MYQQIAWYTTVVLVFLLSLAFAFVYGESKRLKEYGPIQKTGYIIRKYYFIGLVASMVFVSALTLSKLPYHQPHAFATGHAKIVDVKGIQYGWELSNDQFFVGEPVQFNVTSKDVTHGFGLYDENMQLMAQTQVMPGHTNTVYHTFTKPGTYKILCMEYCSVGHHLMIRDIKVQPKGGTSHGK